MTVISPVAAQTAASVVQQTPAAPVDASAARADNRQQAQTPDAIEPAAPAADSTENQSTARPANDGRGQLVDILV